LADVVMVNPTPIVLSPESRSSASVGTTSTNRDNQLR
jgi:hypothetical protein